MNRWAHPIRRIPVLFLLLFIFLLILPASATDNDGGTIRLEHPAYDLVDQMLDQHGSGVHSVDSVDTAKAGSKYNRILISPELPVFGDTISFTLKEGSSLPRPLEYPYRYKWTFGDGSDPVTTDSYTQVITHTYTKPGEYKVHVDVVIGTTKEAFDEMTLSLPTRILTEPVKPLPGGQITFRLDKSFPEGTKIWWDFDDGSARESKLPDGWVQHTFSTPRKYNVTVTVDNIIYGKLLVNLDVLQKGDIFVHAAEGGFSEIIPGRWSHAGMYIGNGQIVESGADGVHVSELSHWSYPDDQCVAVFRVPGLTDTQRDNVVNWALEKAKDHRGYDKVSMIAYAVAIAALPVHSILSEVPPPDELYKQMECSWYEPDFLPCFRYYCSELVWASYVRNGINFDQARGSVLPSNLVDGKWVKVELVGAHIERKSDRFAAYSGTSKYYDLLLLGINNYWPSGSVQKDIAKGNGDLSAVQIILTDPLGRVMRTGANMIPNSTEEDYDLNADGGVDEFDSIVNAVEGEYQLEIIPPVHPEPGANYTLMMGTWDTDQFSMIKPLNNVSLASMKSGTKIPFHIEENGLGRVIALPSRGKAPLMVSFIDISPIESFQNTWSFGDGTTTDDRKTTSHLYSKPGTYMAELRIWDAGTTETVAVPIVVEQGISLEADFTVSPITGNAPLTVQCSDASLGEPTRFNYNFGDGAQASGPNPVHTYKYPGTYSITLTVTKYDPVTNAVISNSTTKTNVVTVHNVPSAPLIANFSASPMNGTAPLTVAFVDKSTGNPTYYTYDFGDGITMIGANPVHTYRRPGVYTVTLTVRKTDAAGGSILWNSSIQKGLIVATGK